MSGCNILGIKPIVLNTIDVKSNCPTFVHVPCEELVGFPNTDPDGRITGLTIKIREMQYKECALKVETLLLCKE